MDYTKWPPQPQQPPPVAPLPIDPYTSHYQFYPQNPNPTPTLSLSHDPALGPPGVDSYASLTSYTYDGVAARPYDLHQTVDTASAGYYLDPNSHNWALKEAGGYAGATDVTVHVNGAEQVAIANPSSTLWTNPTVWPHGNGTWKNRPKKTKIVQSAYCEICKIDCNSKDVLDQHKLGKKHQKNLEKLLEATAPASSASGGSTHPVIGPQENPKTVNGQKSRKKAAETTEDLETKRRKIVEGGAASEAVRACTICNVVCNSERVFSYHLSGQKHAAMVKKLAAGTGVATAT